ncbi:MAG: hypothetical protein JNL24_14305 [Bacteroidia bacterium]|nr:hypothetical protein [Bacteroidia bacterium]
MRKTTAITLGILSISLFATSCKKDEDPQPATTPTPTTNTYPNYFKLETGNYWIYQQYDLDTLGNLTAKNVFDSCYVAADTIINGKNYHTLVKPKPYFPGQIEKYHLIDSLNYVVDASGKIIFSSSDMTSIFATNYYMATASDTLCRAEIKMTDANTSITCDAGTFNTINAKETFYMYPNWQSAGSIRARNTKYAENIGMITETLPFFVSNPNYVERRLIRYHLN